MAPPYRTLPVDPLDRMPTVLAINGFLEWFFLGLLSLLVVVVTVFALFMGVQLFRSPRRSPRPPR